MRASQLTAQIAQMPIEIAALHVVGHGLLENAATEQIAREFHLHDLLAETSGHQPADAVAGRQRVGEAADLQYQARIVEIASASARRSCRIANPCSRRSR